MGYDAYSQMFVGTEIANIVELVTETKTIEVKDEWTDKVKGTKQVSRTHYKFQGEKFTDPYDIEMKLNDLGLKSFMVGCEDEFIDCFVGIGKKTNYSDKVIKMTVDEIQDAIQKAKEVFATLGYEGEVEVYSTLYESY